MLTWDELGLSRQLIAGQIAHRQLPRWGQRVVLGVALSAAVGLVDALWDGLRGWPHGGRRPGTVLLLNGLLRGLLFEALWLYYDRYYLALLPGLTALLVVRLRPTKGVITVGMAGVLLWGTIAVTGTIDQFRYYRTVVEARDWLLRHGVAAEHIDAGYALAGWWLYAHAPDGPPSRGREPEVAWVTGWPVLPYKVANVTEPLYAAVRSFRRPMLWAASDTIYVAAQRHAEAANGEEPPYANLWGYDEPIRSASFRTGVYRIGSVPFSILLAKSFSWGPVR